MAWIRLHKLLVLLRQRRIDLRDITVFVDDHVINPQYRRQLQEESSFEEDEDLYEDDSEED